MGRRCPVSDSGALLSCGLSSFRPGGNRRKRREQACGQLSGTGKQTTLGTETTGQALTLSIAEIGSQPSWSCSLHARIGVRLRDADRCAARAGQSVRPADRRASARVGHRKCVAGNQILDPIGDLLRRCTKLGDSPVSDVAFGEPTRRSAKSRGTSTARRRSTPRGIRTAGCAPRCGTGSTRLAPASTAAGATWCPGI